MRNDLDSLNPGKSCAQAAHCANLLIYLGQQNENPIVSTYLDQGYGFGTTIVLEAAWNEILEYRLKLEEIEDINSNVTVVAVHDPSYPIRDGLITHLIHLETCVGVLGPRNIIGPILQDLPLMK